MATEEQRLFDNLYKSFIDRSVIYSGLLKITAIATPTHIELTASEKTSSTVPYQLVLIALLKDRSAIVQGTFDELIDTFRGPRISLEDFRDAYYNYRLTINDVDANARKYISDPIRDRLAVMLPSIKI